MSYQWSEDSVAIKIANTTQALIYEKLCTPENYVKYKILANGGLVEFSSGFYELVAYDKKTKYLAKATLAASVVSLLKGTAKESSEDLSAVQLNKFIHTAYNHMMKAVIKSEVEKLAKDLGKTCEDVEGAVGIFEEGDYIKIAEDCLEAYHEGILPNVGKHLYDMYTGEVEPFAEAENPAVGVTEWTMAGVPTAETKTTPPQSNDTEEVQETSTTAAIKTVKENTKSTIKTKVVVEEVITDHDILAKVVPLKNAEYLGQPCKGTGTSTYRVVLVGEKYNMAYKYNPISKVLGVRIEPTKGTTATIQDISIELASEGFSIFKAHASIHLNLGEETPFRRVLGSLIFALPLEPLKVELHPKEDLL